MKRRNYLISKLKTNAPYILFAAILSISTAAIFIRFAQETIPSLTIAAYRMVFASLILFPLTIKKSIFEWRRLTKKSIALIVISSFLLALHFLSWIKSLEYTNVTSSVVLVTTTPIWVSIVSLWLLGEKVPNRFFMGLVIALVGIIFINLDGSYFHNGFDIQDVFFGSDRTLLGNLLALVGAICAAGYVVIGRILRRNLSTESYVLSVYSGAGLVLMALALLLGTNIEIHDLTELKWLLLIALIPQVIGHSLLNWALGTLHAYSVAISLLGEPIGSSILAIFFLREIPSKWEVISSVVILLGIIIAVSKKKDPYNLICE